MEEEMEEDGAEEGMMTFSHYSMCQVGDDLVSASIILGQHSPSDSESAAADTDTALLLLCKDRHRERFTPTPPNLFAVICGDKASTFRSYPWGSIDLLNERSSDLSRLQRLLLESCSLAEMLEQTQIFTIKQLQKDHQTRHDSPVGNKLMHCGVCMDTFPTYFIGRLCMYCSGIVFVCSIIFYKSCTLLHWIDDLHCC